MLSGIYEYRNLGGYMGIMLMQDKNNVLLNIKRLVPSLNPALKRIATYILRNPQKVKLLKINVLAKKCKVSESTVTRFVKEAGLGSFQELKIVLAELSVTDIKETEDNADYVFDNISKLDTTQSIINKIVYRNIEAFQEAIKIISPSELEKAASAIQAANILVFYCIGWSKIAAENAKTRFFRVGKPCIIYNDPAQQLESAALFDKQNVAIGISNTGKTLPTVNAMKLAKKSGAKTICITNFETSPIVNYSDIKLFTSTMESPFPEEAVVNVNCQILVLDLLFTCFAVKQFDQSKAMILKSSKYYKLGIESLYKEIRRK